VVQNLEEDEGAVGVRGVPFAGVNVFGSRGRIGDLETGTVRRTTGFGFADCCFCALIADSFFSSSLEGSPLDVRFNSLVNWLLRASSAGLLSGVLPPSWWIWETTALDCLKAAQIHVLITLL
jgi:hypothetical protein